MTSYERSMLSPWLVTVDVHLDHLAKIVFVTGTVNLLSPFPHCSLWKEVTMPSPHVSYGELCSISWTGHDPYRLFGILYYSFSILPNLLIQLFVSFGLIDIYFIL